MKLKLELNIKYNEKRPVFVPKVFFMLLNNISFNLLNNGRSFDNAYYSSAPNVTLCLCVGFCMYVFGGGLTNRPNNKT